MAVIGRIRKHSGLLIIIIGVALAAFVLGDFVKKRPKNLNVLAEVAGEKISPVDFNKKVDENIQLRKQNSGRESLTPEESYEIRQSTYMQMMNDIVMAKQFDELGINVTIDELNDLIRGKNPHPYIIQSFKDPNTGQFDPKMVSNFLQNLDKVDPAMKDRYLMLEKAIKAERLNAKYNALITKGYYVPTAFAKREYEERSRTASVRIVGARYQFIPDKDVKLTDADYQKYYDENSYKFKQDRPTRDLEYVVFDVPASADDRKKIDADVMSLYEEFKTTGDAAAFVNSVSDSRYDSTWHKKGSLPARLDSMAFNAPAGTLFAPFEENNTYYIAKLMNAQARPDSMRASHILITYAGTGVSNEIKRTKDAAKKLADSLLLVIKKDPKLFETLALTKSEDQTSAQKSGDLNWFSDGMMIPAINNTVVNGAIGEIKEVETNYGYHIVKITGKKEPVKKVKIAMVVRKIEPSGKTFQDIFAKANEFAANNPTIETFEKSVTAKNLNKREAPQMEAMTNTIPGINSPREIVRWVFNENTKKGDVSTVFDTDGSYVIAAVKDIRAKGILPLAQIKENIKPLVIREKKAEMLIKKINASLSSSKDLNLLAAAYQSKVDTAKLTFTSPNIPNYGREAELVGTVFGMKTGQMTAPIKGNMGVYIVLIDQITEPLPTKDYSNEKSQLSSFFMGMAPREIPAILEEKAGIKDNRVSFY